jgi:hypothetical protein
VVDAARGLEAGVPAAEVENLKLIGGSGSVFGMFEVDAANPVAESFEVADKMVADKAAGTGDEDLFLFGHDADLLSTFEL